MILLAVSCQRSCKDRGEHGTVRDEHHRMFEKNDLCCSPVDDVCFRGVLWAEGIRHGLLLFVHGEMVPYWAGGGSGLFVDQMRLLRRFWGGGGGEVGRGVVVGAADDERCPSGGTMKSRLGNVDLSYPCCT